MLTIACVFMYEIYREILVIIHHAIEPITRERIALLRLEHTVFGISLGEVMNYVRKRRKRWSQAVRDYIAKD